jgi:hypothetical protein
MRTAAADFTSEPPVVARPCIRPSAEAGFGQASDNRREQAVSDPKSAWDRVGDEMSNLGKKLQQHLDQSGPQSKAAAEAQDALKQMAAAIDGAIEGVGNAVRDPGVRDTATKVAQSFRDALGVSLKKAGENLKGDDSPPKG